MPLALDYEPDAYRPTKRRRFLESLEMARQAMIAEEDRISQESESQTPMEAGCEHLAAADASQEELQSGIQTSDRDELIQCIKRGQRPTWIPKPGLKALYAEERARQERRDAQMDDDDAGDDDDSPISPTNTTFRLQEDLLFGPWTHASESTERPRSLLRGGYFDRLHPSKAADTPASTQSDRLLADDDDPSYSFSSSPPSWLEEWQHSTIGQAVSSTQTLQRTASTPVHANRPRAPSLSSSFIMRVPTSPLVNAVNNPNLDFSPRTDSPEIKDRDRKSRRRTMPPHSFSSYMSSPVDATTPNYSRPLQPPLLRRESSLSSQKHQPRKSIGSFTIQTMPGFTVPNLPMRRSSMAHELSPQRRSSMVGSFEESILRGRMSSPASKPFGFVAQIGVMGKGECSASLKCPAHVSVPFQAVFYSYPSSQVARSIADDAPSPYVGTIDLEHNLKPVQLATKKKRTSTLGSEAEVDFLLSGTDPTAPENTPIGKALARDIHWQQQRPKSASRMNLGGAYRVPEQGQLQIIIKNSQKTAVKLFLVPYDLRDMESGTKTFIRQKSYSSGSIMEGALSGKSQQLNILDPLKDKQILRYLIHIRFCCPSKGKYYLHENIRVVFANRVPDGKEKLKVEVQLPEPRYSPWKPAQSHTRSASTSTIDFSPVASQSRHASSPSVLEDLRLIKVRDSESIPEERSTSSQSAIPLHFSDSTNPAAPPSTTSGDHGQMHFVFPDLPKMDEPRRQPEQAVSPVQGFFASTSPRSSPVPWGSGNASNMRSFSPAPVEAGNGLLSRQFRGLRNSMTSNDTDGAADPWMATVSLTRILSSQDSSYSSNTMTPEPEREVDLDLDQD